MPRLKGSKNKPKTGKLSSAADYAAAIEAKGLRSESGKSRTRYRS